MNQFFSSYGNNTLHTTLGTIKISNKYAKYKDAFRAGYKVEPITPSGHSTGNEPKEDKTWLYLSKEGLDYSLFQKHSLVSVS